MPYVDTVASTGPPHVTHPPTHRITVNSYYTISTTLLYQCTVTILKWNYTVLQATVSGSGGGSGSDVVVCSFVRSLPHRHSLTHSLTATVIHSFIPSVSQSVTE